MYVLKMYGGEKSLPCSVSNVVHKGQFSCKGNPEGILRKEAEGVEGRYRYGDE